MQEVKALGNVHLQQQTTPLMVSCDCQPQPHTFEFNQTQPGTAGGVLQSVPLSIYPEQLYIPVHVKYAVE